jgi:hypothetical protein
MRLNGMSKTPLRKNSSLKVRVSNDLAAIRRSPLSSGRSSWLKPRDRDRAIL